MTSFLSDAWAKDLYEAVARSHMESMSRWIGEPGPEELERYRAQRAAVQPRLHAALDQLANLGGPGSTERKVLDLHARNDYNECQGCDSGSYAESDPSWPCRTVDLIAEDNGIDISDFYLYDRKWSPAQ